MKNSNSTSDPSRSSIIDLVRRWRVLVGVVTLISVVGGAYLGSQAEVGETAEARLVISATQASPEALPGVTQASMTLAGMYARLVTVDPVLAPVAEQIGVPLAELREKVSGSPLPESAIVRVIATAPTTDAAMRTADLIVESLLAYDQSSSDDPAVDEASILASYDEAATQLTTSKLAALRAQTALDALTNTIATDVNGQSVATEPDAEDVATLETELVTAQVQADRASLLLGVYGDAYREAVATKELTLLRSLGMASATGPTPSDLRAGALGGLIVGLGVGTAIAYFLDQRRRPEERAVLSERSSYGAKKVAATR